MARDNKILPDDERDTDENKAKRLKVVAIALCAVGALRVFVFSAAFPFFVNVDEIQHFDTIYRYSRCEIPREVVTLVRPEVAEMMALYHSHEYLVLAEEFTGGRAPHPVWRIPGVTEHPGFELRKQAIQKVENTEAASFPVYYVAAGLWYDIGGMFGIDGVHLLYWMRFANAAIFGAFVWLCHLVAAQSFGRQYHLRVAVLVLAAFFPQDLFYAMTNDVAGAPLLALAMLMLLHLYNEDRSLLYHGAAGLAVSACLLTKISNVAAAAMLAAIVILKARNLASQKNLRAHAARLAVLAVTASAPIILWLIRNHAVFGDFTASHEKAAHLSWTVKSSGRFFEHPIFTIHGVGYFFSELIRTAWRGEIVWLTKTIASPGMDVFYVLLTAACVVASAVGLAFGWKRQARQKRFLLLMSFLVVGTSILLLVVLSMMFDFGGCFYPSQARPYFISARLISCALMPFLFILVNGLDRISKAVFRGKVSVSVIAIAIAAIVTCSEIWLSLPVFASEHNWFHSW